MCFCQPTDPTDCRFHSTKEPGWEECPRLKQAQKDSSLLGRWLWARSAPIVTSNKQSETPAKDFATEIPEGSDALPVV